MSMLSASSFSDHYLDALKIVVRVADLVGMADDAASFPSKPRNAADKAERAISQLDRGVAAGSMTRQMTQGPGSLRGLFVRQALAVSYRAAGWDA